MKMRLKQEIRKLASSLAQYVITVVVVTLLAGWIFSLISAVLVFRDAGLMQEILQFTPVFAAIEGFLTMLAK